MNSCAVQSRKWQLIGKSQWCRSAVCAATTHTTGPNQHSRALPHKHSPEVPTSTRYSSALITAYYSFIDLERTKGWVGLVGLPVADGLPTIVVTHQLLVKRMTAKVRRPEIAVTTEPLILPYDTSVTGICWVKFSGIVCSTVMMWCTEAVGWSTGMAFSVKICCRNSQR